MSAYITLMTPMTDQECLLQALADVGFTLNKVEIHTEPAALVGYEGANRAQRAHLIIRRSNLGSASNDIGFLNSPTGFSAIVSNYDQRLYGQEWLGRLNDHYRAHADARRARLDAIESARLEEERRKLVEAQRVAVTEKARKLGYQVKETREGETIRLQLVRRSY